MKKGILISIISIFMISVILAGCSSNSGGSSSGSSNGSDSGGNSGSDKEQITLTYWGAGHVTRENQTYGDWDKMMAKKFHKMHPNVTVKFQVVGGADFTKKVNTAIKGGNPPDIIGTNAPLRIMQYARHGLLEPLGEKVFGDMSDWKESVIKNGKYNGKYYAVTTVIGPQVLVVNKQIFKEAGKMKLLPEDHDWTWDEFVHATKEIQKVTDGIYGTAFWAKNAQVNQNNLTYLMSYGAQWVNEDFDRYLINKPKGVEALTRMVELVDNGIVAPAPASSDYKAGFKLFKQGRLIAYWAAPGEMFGVDNPNFEPYPIVPLHAEGVAPGVPVTGEQGIAIFKQDDPEKLKWAKKYLKFITSTEAIKETAKGWLYIPARKSSNYDMKSDDYKAFAKYQKLYAPLDKEQTGKFVPWFAELRQHIYPNLQGAFLHELSPQKALDRIVKKGNTLAKQAQSE